MNNVLKNIIRTLVPAVVGSLITWGLGQFNSLSPGDFALIYPLISTGYYALIRVGEEKWPWLGWLLGSLPPLPAPPAE